MFEGMSSHINFLFPPRIRAFQNRFGFKFCKGAPLKGTEYSPYFILVNVRFIRFFILEKDSIIEDIDGNPFTLENLDCFDITMSLIKKLSYKRSLLPITFFTPNNEREFLL